MCADCRSDLTLDLQRRNDMMRSSQPLRASDDRSTAVHATPAARDTILAILVRVMEAGLGLLFLYLGVTKLLGIGEATEFATAGVSSGLRYSVAILELGVSVLLFSRVAEGVLNAMMVAAALIEMGLLKRPPIAVFACMGTHGLTNWVRSAHKQGRALRTQVSDFIPAPSADGATDPEHRLDR
jgi:hypothetical protein